MGPTSAIFAFVDELADFSCELSGLDRVWHVLSPGQGDEWQRLHINQYRQTFFVTHVSGDADGLEIEPGKGVRTVATPGAFSSGDIANQAYRDTVWEPLIISARQWLKVVRKDWITANRRVQAEYPLRYRYGILPNALVRASLPDVCRLDRELGITKTRKLARLVEDGFFIRPENTERMSMTAEDYFTYCRIAYLAGKSKGEEIEESLSGRDMYARYADGRHEGLLDIDPSSAQEFAEWLDGTHPKRETGGHPWEIKRGGNTTHIDLAVFRPSVCRKEGFKVELRGEASSRMVETMRMFLAIHNAGLPVSIANPEGVRKRLLAQDNIGIIPAYASLHRANQHFGKDDDVFDVMHYDDLGRFKRRTTPFITWEPLPILKPGDP